MRLGSDRFRTGNDRCSTQILGLRAVQGNCQRGARVWAISVRKTQGPGAENPEKPQQLEIAAPRASEPSQLLDCGGGDSKLRPRRRPHLHRQPWKVPPHQGCPTKPVGDRLVEGQPRDPRTPTLRADGPRRHGGGAGGGGSRGGERATIVQDRWPRPVRAHGQSRGWPPRACRPYRLLLNRGAAATDGAQPEQVAAAMEVDAPARAGSPVPVTGAVTELATGAAMEGVQVEGQAALEEEELPGPLAMVVYTGGASGAAAEIGAATATAPSPVQGAAPVTPAPARPSLSPEAVGQQRTGSLGRLYRQTVPTTAHGASGWAPAPTTRESMPKRKAVTPAVGERRSTRVAKAVEASPETGKQPVSPVSSQHR